MPELSQSAASREEVRAALGRILCSEMFSSSRRLSSFLEFIVDSALQGSSAKEAVIGVEVYGRDAAYNPKTDSIVRAEASRLRAKLREYYDGPGRLDSVVIELPKGSYVPVFTARTAQADSPARPRQKIWVPWIAAAACVLGVTAFAVIPRMHPRRSIAVMPLRILGDDSNVRPLAETLGSHLTQALLASRSWKVAGQAPILDLAGSDQALTPLRRDLAADAVLTGSIRALSRRDARLTLELVNVADGYLVWRQTYDRGLGPMTESQAVLARAAVHALTEKYTGRPEPSHDASYARAREFWSTYTTAGLQQSIPHFQQAIRDSPNFAAASAGLADAYIRLSDDASEIDTRDKVEAARKAALQAIAIDDTNSEAHSALGRLYLFKDWNFPGAVEQLQRAVALDPTRVWPSLAYSQALTITGKMEDALAAIQDARSRLPALADLSMQEGSVYFLARKFEKMEALGRELLALEPENPSGRWLVGLSLELRGRSKEAIREYGTGLGVAARDDLRILCALSHAYASVKERAKALDAMGKILPNPDAPPTRFTLAYCAALTNLALGNPDEAFRWLDVGLKIHDQSLPFFPWDARFDPLKSDPRYAQLTSAILKPRDESRK